MPSDWLRPIVIQLERERKNHARSSPRHGAPSVTQPGGGAIRGRHPGNHSGDNTRNATAVAVANGSHADAG